MKIKYFTSAKCGSCKLMKPTIDELSNQGYDIEIIDTGTEKGFDMAKDEAITATPSLIIKGKFDRRVLVGPQHEDIIVNEIKRQLKDEE